MESSPTAYSGLGRDLQDGEEWSLLPSHNLELSTEVRESREQREREHKAMTDVFIKSL